MVKICILYFQIQIKRLIGGKGEIMNKEKPVENAENEFIKIENLQNEQWNNVSIGKYHIILHSVNNAAVSLGYGGSGQLGIPIYQIINSQNTKQNYKNNEELPFKYEFSDKESYIFNKENFHESSTFCPLISNPLPIKLPDNSSILKISCGKCHTVFISENQQIFTCGNFANGRLGLGKNYMNNVGVPILIKPLSMHKFDSVSCGKNFTLALTAAGKVFAWGRAKNGVLGTGNNISDEWDPVMIDNLCDIVYIYAGNSHCGAINSKGKLFMWGKGDKGQLGMKILSGETCVSTPQLVSNSNISNKIVNQLALGKNHTLALVSNFEVYGWGSNENGQLGISKLPPTIMQKGNQIIQPTIIKSLSGKGICRIAAGRVHSCGLSLNGMLYTWGDNKNGQLGHTIEMQYQGIPMIVKSLIGKPLTNVYAGYDYTVVIESLEVSPIKNKEQFESWKKSVIQEEQKDIKKINQTDLHINVIKTEKNRRGKSSFSINKNLLDPIEFKGKNTFVRNGERNMTAMPNIRRKGKIRRKYIDGPLLVTNKAKIYKFNRNKDEENTYVTVFTETAEKSSPMKTIEENSPNSIYDKFWYQNLGIARTRDNASIFFADKNLDSNDENIEEIQNDHFIES